MDQAELELKEVEEKTSELRRQQKSAVAQAQKRDTASRTQVGDLRKKISNLENSVR